MSTPVSTPTRSTPRIRPPVRSVPVTRGFPPEVRQFGKRVFIVVAVLNIVVSQPLAGNILTLLCRNMLQASKLTIGTLVLAGNLTFVGLLIGTPLTARWGKHVLITRAYTAASILVLPLLLIRWIAASYGTDVAMAVVFVATTLRMLTQQIGGAAWFPIMHDLVQEDRRGRFLGTMRTCWQAANVATIVGVSLLFSGELKWWHFEVVFALAAVGRVFWLIAVWKIPKLPPTAAQKAKGRNWRTIFACLRERRFVIFLIYVSLFFMAFGIIEPFRIVYTTESLALSNRFALLATSMMSVGAIISLRYWGQLSDRFGNRGVFGISTVSLVFVSLGWLLVDASVFGRLLIIVLYLLAGVFISANGIARTRYMLAAMENRDVQASFSTVTMTVVMLSTGLASLIGGGVLHLLDHENFRWHHGAVTLNEYQLMFLVSALLFLLPNALRRSLRAERELPTSVVLGAMTRPLRTMMGPLVFWSKVPLSDGRNEDDSPPTSPPHG